MRYGEDREHLRKTQNRAWKNRPILYDDLQDTWNAFWNLSNRRNTGFAVCAVSFTDMRLYVDDMELDEEERKEMIDLLTRMDNHFVNYFRDK